ncbi:MAG: acetyltransferase [Gemmatimonadaceae bacterium]|nr:acetyltransferase [Chitinophagaceae bacterium]
MLKKLVVWGASGHALVVADILRLGCEYNVVGFLDDISSEQKNRLLCDLPVFAGRNFMQDLMRSGVYHVIFGFGNCEARLNLAKWSQGQGFSIATAIHPNATVAAGVSVGPGTVIAAGAVVNPGARIGENVIVNTCASVDHECVLDDGVHICPGAHLAGRVSVGRASWVGIGTSVVDRVRIGAGVMIGAGSVVVNDIPDGVLAYGVPAKVIKRL